jgi:type IV secretory pathway TrbD component
VTSCPHCGRQLDEGVRYCPQCGRRVDDPDASDTHVMDVPPNETGRVPVHVTRAEPRFYGITPWSLVLVLAGAAAAVAVVMFVLGHWPIGLLLAGVALLLVLVFLESARRTPRGSLPRSTVEAVDSFRARTTVAAESVATRGRAARQLFALRRELRRMSAARSQLLFELGAAVYGGAEQAANAARERLVELDRLAAQREAEMEQIVKATRRRVEQGRLEVQPTEVAETPGQPQTPAPGEGNPPEPARIPEQYPPPDELTPPQPAVIPEPGPVVIPEPGPAVIPEPGPQAPDREQA